ncbi:MAG: hypothetical protein CBD32_07175 [Actinobacteria bacterium TMED172]|nr:hypothetical protein [Cellvibrionales bacterium]OUW32150.1 MAG: hypothetical protein CBD32_07175 [Actinobacteria bacterium TMED172]|tara:strand:- start:28039 stop:28971 length:933 start_codon:yes stop_codon:yes gene_type:complete
MTNSNSKFTRRSSAEQVTEGIDLNAKTVLITGVNSGLGFESMRILAMRGAHIIAAARSLEKAEQACAEVKTLVHGATMTPVACELSEPDSVLACVKAVQEKFTAIDILMANAGIMSPATLQIANGYAQPLEMQFATNHIGHFLLISHLLPQLKNAQQGRIVLLSSMGHVQTPKVGIDFTNLDGSKGYNPWQGYGQSKLANILCAKSFSQQLAGTNVTANAVHPGVIRTNLSRYSAGPLFNVIQFFANFFQRSVAQGAATQCYVATHPSLSETSGAYFADSDIAAPSKQAQDSALAQQLWNESLRLVEGYL